MKYPFNYYLLAALAILCLALPAFADDAAPQPKSVCIRSYDIDHTSIPDDNTIIFHMRNHKAFKNTLVARCVGLRNNTQGFTYSPTDPGTDEICSNLFTIRVNDTGQVCLPGAFTPIDPTTAR